MRDIDISELSRRTGLRASALRHYEEKGLITPSGRRGLKRLFDPGVQERLSLIALGRASGFSLDELSEMLKTPDPETGAPVIDKTRLKAKADVLGQRIQSLSRMREGLLHACACTAPSLMECPRFRRIVSLAGRPRPRTTRAKRA